MSVGKMVWFLCEFDFEVKIVRKKEKKSYNALNIKMHVVVVSICKLDLKKRVVEFLARDDHCIQVRDILQVKTKKEFEGYCVVMEFSFI